MPTTAAYTFGAGRLQAALRPEKAVRLSVALKASTTFPAGQVLGEVIATPGTYAPYSGAAIAAPTVQAAASAPTGSDGTLPAATYRIGYTWTNASGESTMSPESADIVVGSTNHIPVTAVTPLPTGVTGVNWYIRYPASSPDMFLVASNVGATFNITAPPADNAATPPRTNTLHPADGTGVAAGLLEYPCVTDSAGNITSVGEFGQTTRSTPMIVGGGSVWKTQDLTGMDAAAVETLAAHLVEGNLTTGLIEF